MSADRRPARRAQGAPRPEPGTTSSTRTLRRSSPKALTPTTSPTFSPSCTALEGRPRARVHQRRRPGGDDGEQRSPAATDSPERRTNDRMSGRTRTRVARWSRSPDSRARSTRPTPPRRARRRRVTVPTSRRVQAHRQPGGRWPWQTFDRDYSNAWAHGKSGNVPESWASPGCSASRTSRTPAGSARRSSTRSARSGSPTGPARRRNGDGRDRRQAHQRGLGDLRRQARPGAGREAHPQGDAEPEPRAAAPPSG